jgi:hypothetical protein
MRAGRKTSKKHGFFAQVRAEAALTAVFVFL